MLRTKKYWYLYGTGFWLSKTKGFIVLFFPHRKNRTGLEDPYLSLTIPRSLKHVYGNKADEPYLF